MRELLALSHAKPGALSFASPAVGSGLHLAGELFKQQTGADILHVPYKGTGPALADVLSGHVPLMMGSLHSMLPHIRAGKLRAIGVTDSVRSTAAPEIPTLSEQGASRSTNRHWCRGRWRRRPSVTTSQPNVPGGQRSSASKASPRSEPDHSD